MAGRNFHVHLVSDFHWRDRVERGACLSRPVRGHLRAGARLVAGAHPGPNGKSDGEVERNRGPVLYTLVDPDLRDQVRDRCRQLQLPCVGVLDQAMSVLGLHFHSKSEQWPGRQHQLDEGYFDRIDAMHYTLAHDDGSRRTISTMPT
jgi:hypothetical protein